MPPSTPLGNSSLIAILLNIETSGGPNLVFHYPPKPRADGSSPTVWNQSLGKFGPAGTTQSNSSSDDGWSSGGSQDAFEDDDTENESDTSSSSRKSQYGAGGGGGRGGRADEDRRKGRGRVRETESEIEWEYVLGFSTVVLQKLLVPRKSFHKKKFEVGLDSLVFLGYPVFSKEGGGWKNKKKKKKKKPEDEGLPDGELAVQENDKNDAGRNEGGKEETGRSAESTHGDSVSFAVNGNDNKQNDRKTDVGMDQKQNGDNGAVGGEETGNSVADENESSKPIDSVASDAGSDNKSTTPSIEADNEMNMFNLVFVLKPPILEYRTRVMDMYDNVVKKFVKTLKYEQACSNYVLDECRKIIEVKEKAKEDKENITEVYDLWAQILAASPLAKSIAVVFDSISASKIAHINVGTLDTFLQIPQPVSTSFLPTPSETQTPGLWLTTATLIDDDSDTSLSPYCALLLLEDAETMLKEIESDTKEPALAYYIRQSKPTKSLKKVSIESGIPLSDIKLLAGHLIYWRRARAIPPLHARDTYILSPNADMHALRSSIDAYAARFPTLPSMPEMLHKLSLPPRPYTTLIPSKDHQPAYMEILAWLMRGGWVTQLRTFAWIKVSPEVKLAVAAQSKLASADSEAGGAVDDGGRGRSSTTPTTVSTIGNSTLHRDLGTGALGSASGGADMPSTPARTSPLASTSASVKPSPMLAAHRPHLTVNQPRPSSAAGSVSSGRTVVPAGRGGGGGGGGGYGLGGRRAASIHGDADNNDEGNDSNDNSNNGDGDVINDDSNDDLDDESGTTEAPAASLIQSPHKASGLESRWIEHIGRSMGDSELAELWPGWARYFDGKHALDEIAAREGLKRTRVAALLGQLRELGVLLTVRHW